MSHCGRKSSETMSTLLGKAGAVVMVSHGLGRLQEFCDTFAWLDRGKLMAVGPPREVTALYRQHIGVPAETEHDD